MMDINTLDNLVSMGLIIIGLVILGKIWLFPYDLAKRNGYPTPVVILILSIFVPIGWLVALVLASFKYDEREE
jgi:hypothetical protein